MHILKHKIKAHFVTYDLNDPKKLTKQHDPKKLLMCFILKIDQILSTSLKHILYRKDALILVIYVLYYHHVKDIVLIIFLLMLLSLDIHNRQMHPHPKIKHNFILHWYIFFNMILK